MKFNYNKKVIGIIFIALAILIGFGIYKYEFYKPDKDISINTFTSRGDAVRAINTVGNANYFNQSNGKYYADQNYTIEANDNTGYLLSLFQSTGTVRLPAGNFLCKTKIILNGDLSLTGVEGMTKIVFDSKTFENYGYGALNECLIINANYANEYKADTAQNISVSGIIFEYKRYSNYSPKTIMLLKNIKSARILNCSFISDLPNGTQVNDLDLYNGCKNVIVANCNFINKTKASSGGCIWVRNLTDQLSNKEGNTTENININKCFFEKDSKDEVIAVFSVIGDVKNVVIRNCVIKDYSEKQQVVLAAYSSPDEYYGTVDDVIISNNDIYSEKFNAFIILTGVESNRKPTSNIIIANNKIVTKSQNELLKTIIYNSVSNKDSNIIANNNEIITTIRSKYMAIANVKYVEGNKITGPFETAIFRGTVINNEITGAVSGVVSADAVINNTISEVKYGIRLYSGGNCCINNNTVVLDSNTGFCGLELISQDHVTCTKNTVKTFSASQYSIIARGANIIFNGNQILGDGNSIIKPN